MAAQNGRTWLDDSALSQILGILILNEQAERIAIQYTTSAPKYDSLKTTQSQKLFEQDLVDKAVKQGSRSGQDLFAAVQIISHKDLLCLIRNVSDVNLVVIGDPNENELLLLQVLDTLYTSLQSLNKGRMSANDLMKSIDKTFLVLDEILEESIIFETDPATIVKRVTMGHGSLNLGGGEELSESQSFNKAISAARDGIIKGILGNA